MQKYFKSRGEKEDVRKRGDNMRFLRKRSGGSIRQEEIRILSTTGGKEEHLKLGQCCG